MLAVSTTRLAEPQGDNRPAPDPLVVFTARCEARATLWQAGELDLHEAVDELQAAAVRDGLVAKLGADEVQQILARCFAAVRDDTDTLTIVKVSTSDMVPDPLPDDEYDGLLGPSDNCPKVITGLFNGAKGLETTRGALEPTCRDNCPSPSPQPAQSNGKVLAAVSANSFWAGHTKRIPTSTLRAAEYLVREADRERLQRWLAKHNAEERAGIQKHLGRRACR